MENEITKKVSKIFAPTWMFWIKKEKTLEDIASHHSKAIFAIPYMIKYMDEHISNQKLVSHAMKCISEVCNPVLDLIDDFDFSHEGIQMPRHFKFHERDIITKFRADIFLKIDSFYIADQPVDKTVINGIDKIAHFLTSGNSVLEFSALECLGQAGPPARHKLSLIKDYLKHPEFKFRLMAQFAVENISGENCGFLDEYFRVLKDQDFGNANQYSDINSIFEFNNPYFGLKIRKRLPELIEILESSINETVKMSLLLSTVFPLAEEELNTEEQKLLDILFDNINKDNTNNGLLSYLIFLFLNPKFSIPYLVKKLHEKTLTIEANTMAEASTIIIALVEIKVGTKDEVPLIKENIEIMKKKRPTMTDEDRVVLYNIEKSFKELLTYHGIV